MPSAYFIGIKGVGMTSLALAMQDAGWTISGSDTGESFITDPVLSERGVPVMSPLTTPVPGGIDLVVYSGAYDKPSSGEPALSLAEALAEFVKDRRVIAVAGVGGKTTTSAMLALLLHSAGRDVGYYVGTGNIAGLDAPGASGTDPWYIVEADEYAVSKSDKRAKMNLLSPEILVTTNLLYDHPDLYPDVNSTFAAYAQLVSRIKPNGTWIYHKTDQCTQKILATKPSCQLIPYSANLPPLKLSVFGAQNKLDAQAAVLAAAAAGLPHSQAVASIKSYRGCGRRQEFHGEVADRLLYDDYAHHPHEILATLQAFKANFPSRRILVVFESHTYSRTQALLPQFAAALSHADLAFIMPIFESAREKGQPHSVTPASFASLIPGAAVLTWENAAAKIWSTSQSGDLILTMGAGFVYKLHDQFTKIPQP